MTVGSEFEGVKPTPPGVGQRLEVRGSKKEARGSTPPTPPANRTLHQPMHFAASLQTLGAIGKSYDLAWPGKVTVTSRRTFGTSIRSKDIDSINAPSRPT